MLSAFKLPYTLLVFAQSVSPQCQAVVCLHKASKDHSHNSVGPCHAEC
jgi:hypothetical protein